MKKKWIVFALAMGILLALPACGGQSAQENTRTEQGNASGDSSAVSGNTNTGTGQNGGGQASSGITQETARTLALQQAGVKEADVLASGVREEYDDGRKCYEVVFYTKDADYEYLIDQEKGTLVESDREMAVSSWSTPEGAKVTKEEAQEMILERVPGAKTDHIRMKAEVEHGRILYEGEVIYGDSKYEYEMDAQTGDLLEWSQGDLF